MGNRCEATQEHLKIKMSYDDTQFEPTNLPTHLNMPDGAAVTDVNEATKLDLPPAKKQRRRVVRPAGGPAFSLADIKLPSRSDLDDAAPLVELEAAMPDAAAAEPVTPQPEKVMPIRTSATALLFQAPDLTPRKPRRASAPAGPPREHKVEEPEIAESTVATKAAAGNKSKFEKPAKQNRVEGQSRVEDEADEAAPSSSSNKYAKRPMSRAESQAAAEVGAIEAEIFADGGEPEHFTELDLVEDTEDVELEELGRRRRRRGGRGRRINGKGEGSEYDDETDETDDFVAESKRERRGNNSNNTNSAAPADDADADNIANTEDGNTRRRRQRGTKADRADTRGDRYEQRDRYETRDRSERSDARASREARDEVTALKGSTRLEAKRQRRRESRQTGRRRQIVSEAEFLARRENVDRKMVIREIDGRTQIAVTEDGVLVEHYVSAQAQASMVGNVYLGRVQNVLPSMEAAFVDVGKGRNAVLYAGEVNWDAAGIESASSRRIEQALKPNDVVLVQVTKDPIGQKGARLTSQITLAGRYLVLVPEGGMTGISRKLPEAERDRLKRVLRQIVPEGSGVIVRTAAAGASEEELRLDVERLQAQWEAIQEKANKPNPNAPVLLQGEPDLSIRVVRDIFNDDFNSLIVAGGSAYHEIKEYVGELAPDLKERVTLWNETGDVFAAYRVDEQLAKGMDRKVWLPSGGSLVIDRTEAMTVVDVNTGKFTGEGGTLEETVTRNNLEAAEEIVRQLRLRDIGGIIVIDFIDMVLESNRDLVLRRLVECLGRDRTKHQVAEVTSLGLVQMTRKRVGQGLVEAFSSVCEHCNGRGFMVNSEPIEAQLISSEKSNRNGRNNRHEDTRELEPAITKSNGHHDYEAGEYHPMPGDHRKKPHAHHGDVPVLPEDHSQAREAVKATLATIAAAAAHAHEHEHDHEHHSAAVTFVETEPETTLITATEEFIVTD